MKRQAYSMKVESPAKGGRSRQATKEHEIVVCKLSCPPLPDGTIMVEDESALLTFSVHPEALTPLNRLEQPPHVHKPDKQRRRLELRRAAEAAIAKTVS